MFKVLIRDKREDFTKGHLYEKIGGARPQYSITPFAAYFLFWIKTFPPPLPSPPQKKTIPTIIFRPYVYVATGLEEP